MLPGPVLIIECPGCQAPLLEETILSGNTFGAVQYTDGYLDAPMMPTVPRLAACPACKGPFLRGQARRLGTVDRKNMRLWESKARPGLPREWLLAPPADDPQQAHYLQQLAAGGLEAGVELALRVELWQLANHTRRKLEPGAPYPVPGRDELANLRRIAALCNPAEPEQRLLLAEVARQTGAFERARQLLSGGCAEAFPEATARLLELVDARDPKLAEL